MYKNGHRGVDVDRCRRGFFLVLVHVNPVSAHSARLQHLTAAGFS